MPPCITPHTPGCAIASCEVVVVGNIIWSLQRERFPKHFSASLSLETVHHSIGSHAYVLILHLANGQRSGWFLKNFNVSFFTKKRQKKIKRGKSGIYQTSKRINKDKNGRVRKIILFGPNKSCLHFLSIKSVFRKGIMAVIIELTSWENDKKHIIQWTND